MEVVSQTEWAIEPLSAAQPNARLEVVSIDLNHLLAKKTRAVEGVGQRIPVIFFSFRNVNLAHFHA